MSIIYRQQKLFWGQNRLHRRRLELPVGYGRQKNCAPPTKTPETDILVGVGFPSPLRWGVGTSPLQEKATTSGDLKQHLIIIKKRYHVSAKGHDTAYYVNFRHNHTICFESRSENIGYFRGNNLCLLCHLFYA